MEEGTASLQGTNREESLLTRAVGIDIIKRQTEGSSGDEKSKLLFGARFYF